jgi:hypothetical protein
MLQTAWRTVLPRLPTDPGAGAAHGSSHALRHGSHEKDTLCPDLPQGVVDAVRLEGGHHFDGDYRGLGRLILEKAR